MRKVNVFHLIKSLNRGGAETLLSEGLRFNDAEHFELSYGYFNPALNALAPVLSSQGASVTCFGGDNHFSMLRRTRRVANVLRAQEIDVLHCHLPLAGVVGRLAGRIAGVPVVYTEHNKPEWYRKPTFLLNSWTYGLQDQVVAVSASVEQSVRRHIRPRVPVTVVRNGIDADAFCRSAEHGRPVRQQFGISDSSVVVGNVAALIPQKRLHDWIEAARLVHQRHPDTFFLLVGEGPQHAELGARIEASGLAGVAHLCGVQTDVRSYLSAMDIYMMSSAFEGLPVALLEAMAASCAPVCTAVGGIPEVIVDGSNGFLVEPGEPGQLADSTARLVADRERLGALATAARQTVHQDFRIARMSRALESVYVEVLARRGMEGARTGAGASADRPGSGSRRDSQPAEPV